MMKALQGVVGKAGGNMSEASREAILALIDDDSSDQTGKIMIQVLLGLMINKSRRLCCHHQRPSSCCACEGASCHKLGSSHQVWTPFLYVDFIRSWQLTRFRNRVLGGPLSHASILGINALLAECPEVLTEHFAVELPPVICQGITNKDVCETPTQA